MSLEGKVVIITGGTSGIGLTSAKKFIQQGAKVLIVGTNEKKGEKVANEIKTSENNVFFFKADVSNYKSVENMVDKAIEVFGTVDILFNNAGINFNKPLLEQTEEDYLKVIKVNQHGVFNGIHVFGKKLVELNKKGTIINTASIAARMTGATMIGYATSKAAVEMLTKTAAIDLAPYGIRVVGVGPGVINTPLIAELKKGSLEYLKNMHARKEILEPEQIADVVVFLAKEEASGINGQIIFVDDGYINFK